jgi:hypothetical protein
VKLTREQELALMLALDGEDDDLPIVEWQKLDALSVAVWTSWGAWELTETGRLLATAIRERDEARAVLAKLEWSDAGWCPVCDREQEEGHAPDCRLAAAKGGE